jgi:hypothetical protein
MELNARNNLSRTTAGAESGVTLLISILIMSGVVMITLVVSYLAVLEIRSSRGTVLTEPSLAAAQSAGEQALWQMKRYDADPQVCPAGYTSLSGQTGNSRTLMQKCIRYEPAILKLRAGQELSFFLYDPQNINTNLCMNVNFDQNPCTGLPLYDRIDFDYLNGSHSVNIEINTVDNVSIGSLILTSAFPSQSFSIPDPILGSQDERLKVTIQSVGDTTIRVNANSPANPSLSGMPDYPTLDTEGCSANSNISSCNDPGEIFKRRINITVPK